MRTVPTRRFVLFGALAAAGCTLDLLTKSWVFARLGMPGQQPTDWLLARVLGFTTSLNEGALFGIGRGGVGLFALFAASAAVAIPVWLFRFGAARDFQLTIALGCIMGGILGNLYDRLGFPQLTWDRFDPTRAGEPVRAVRDWILWQWNSQWVWPNFNIADALLVCGAGLLLVQGFRTGPPQATPGDNQTNKNSKKL